MQLSVQMNKTDLSEALTSYVERRLRFALGRFGDRVGGVRVQLGADSHSEVRCRVSTDLRPFGRVAVEEVDPDLFAAIDRATGRIGRLFGRELERVRERRIGRESVRFKAA